jgi:hexosaminidase
MNRTLLIILLAFLAVNCNGQSIESIIPAPLSVTKLPGSFVLSTETKISFQLHDHSAASLLTALLYKNVSFKPFGNPLTNQPVTGVMVTDSDTDGLSEEGYRLTISPNLITINAKKAGLLYAIQTLVQLFPLRDTAVVVLPCVKIIDQPRFAYRGLMLDVSRHFFTVKEIKDLLDLMAAYKLNRFHWHLTDDQGWRIEIKSYPKLTQVGAWRVPRKDFYGADAPQPGEKATDGGAYSQEQIKEIVRYAAQRNIQVMPEIDVPGHSMAAIAAYPELSVTKNINTKVNPGSSFARWFPGGGFEMFEDNTLNPADEKVYTFLDKVFGEVAALFPYEYIHIGGDECYKGFWEKDAGVKAFMKKKGIQTTHGLQEYFTGRVAGIIRSKHKKAIGWDEIDNGQLNAGTAVMNRFGENGAISQTKRKIDIVLAPGGNGLYFDYAQSGSDMEPINHGGYAPVWSAYGYNAEYEKMIAGDKKHILGVEACIWTEGMNTVSKINYMILPRMLGLAETAWSALENKNYGRFAGEALNVHLARFDQQGLVYRVPTAFNYTDTTITGKHFRFEFRPPVKGSKIYYTLNNRFPSEADHQYQQPIEIHLEKDKKTVLKTVVVAPSGKRSVVTRTVMINPSPKKAGAFVPKNNGLKYQLSLVSGLIVKIDSGFTSDVGLEKLKKIKDATVKLKGYILVPEDGFYEFSTKRKSAVIILDGAMAFDAGKPYPRFDRSDPLHLEKGFHNLSVDYTEFEGNDEPIVWKKLGGKEQNIQAKDIFY